MMINKSILQLLPLSLLSLLLLSCSDLIAPLKNLPDGYARVSVFNYSDIPVSVAFDSGEYSDLDTKGAATENDEVVALAGFGSTFFDVKVSGESRKVWLKIPAGTTAKVLSLTPNSTREFTTGLESIYKRRVRLKFYNYDKSISSVDVDTGGGGVLVRDENYLLSSNSDLFKEGTSELPVNIKLKPAVILGTPEVTNVDLIVSGSGNTFTFDWTGTSFGKNETKLTEEIFRIGPDEPKEYVYYSGMKCRFTVTFDKASSNSRYDLLTYAFQPVGEEQKPSETVDVGLLRDYARDKAVDTPINYSPTARFEYDLMVTESLNGSNGITSRLSKSPIGNFVCTRNTSEPLKVKVYYGASGFYLPTPSTPTTP